jgi:polyphosphate kinase 2 (PPK2 family)
MFQQTQKAAPWKIIKANRKTNARIRAFEYILNQIPYENKDVSQVKHKPFKRIVEDD